MRPVSVAMGCAVGEYGYGMKMPDGTQPVKSLTTDRADEALGEYFVQSMSDRGADGWNTSILEDLVEARGEPGISATDAEQDGMRNRSALL